MQKIGMSYGVAVLPCRLEKLYVLMINILKKDKKYMDFYINGTKISGKILYFNFILLPLSHYLMPIYKIANLFLFNLILTKQKQL